MSTKTAHYPSVASVVVKETRGPWTTKSGGILTVPFAMSDAEREDFFSYDPAEMMKVPETVRGFRIYTVRDIPKSHQGGGEWHRIRKEVVSVLEGRVDWLIEDAQGRTKRFMLDAGSSIWMPPYILHSYKALESDSGLIVMANTEFDPDDRRTHDTYPADAFRRLKFE